MSLSASISRTERLAGFCSYLKEKHKHLSREQRSFRRERKSQHALQKALLQAAKEEPHHSAQLIQEQHKETSTGSRYKHTQRRRIYVAWHSGIPLSIFMMLQRHFSCWVLICVLFHSTALSLAGLADSGSCLAVIKGKECQNPALPFSRHCFHRILSKLLMFGSSKRFA